MKAMKKMAIALIMVVLTFCILSIPSFAVSEEVIVSGSCGDNVIWELDANYVLTISGSGDMDSWSVYGPYQPWYYYRPKISSVVIQDGITSIGSYAFQYCTNLTSVTIPSSVTSIGYNSFSCCPGLVSITIPDGVIEIRDGAFSHCTNLSSVNIPPSVTYIGYNAFDGCDSLANVTIQEGVTGIRESAFRNCSALTNITIPGSVTYVGRYAFEKCEALTEISFIGSAPTIDSTAFYGVTAVAFYPCDDGMWTQDVLQNYGGNLSWEGKHCVEEYTSYIEATCTENAIVTGHCKICNTIGTVSLPDTATGHSLGEYSIIKEATCTNDAVMGAQCEICGEIVEVYALGTATGHSFDGEGICTICGVVNEVVVNLYDSWGDGWNGNYLYVYEDGVRIGYYTLGYASSGRKAFSYYRDRNYTFRWSSGSGAGECSFEITLNNEVLYSAKGSDCESFSYKTIIYSMGDDCEHYYDVDITAPACIVDGYTTYTCACGDSYVADVVAAVGHNYVDGVCTTCGEKDPDYVEVVLPVLTLQNPTLAFEDEILYNVYFNVDDMSNIAEMGMVTFAERDVDGTVDNALEVIPGYVANADGSYTVHSNGIPAKMLGDAVYFKVYAKLSDGSYVYSGIAGYHAVLYANTVLKSDAASAKAKALVVAMLNYGAAAQVDFDYKADSLMNAGLTAEQLALVEDYSESMVAQVPAAGDKAGGFVLNNGYSDVHPTVSFEGAFSINYYFTPKYTPDDGVTFYYWNLNDFNNAEVLTPANATGTVKMTSATGVYTAPVEGIAAKQIDEPVYVAGMYTNGGMSYLTPVIGYSLGNYCKNIAANGNAFGAATAVYGYYAKAYFA